jgi:hypothetical protein
MKKLFIMFIFLFVFSILLSVNNDFNSKAKIMIGVENTEAAPPKPPPR